MKKLLFLVGLLVSTPAFAATNLYFSNNAGGNIGLGSNANVCSLASPCFDPKGKGYNVAAAIPSDTTIWLDGGDTWEGSTSEIRIISNGTGSGRINLRRYGSGTATLKGLTTQASGWTLCSSGCPANTYYLGSQNFTEFHYYSVTESPTRGLFKWGSGYGNLLSTLPVGHFWIDFSADRVYVRTWDEQNPNTLGTVSVPTFVTAPSNDGRRGLVCTGCENGSYGDYVTIDMDGIKIEGSNGMGITLGGIQNIVTDTDPDDVDIMGAGKDGLLAYHNQVAGEEADDAIVENIQITYSAAAGTGNGQAFTWYSPRFLGYRLIAHHNAMAGIDGLKGTIAAADPNFSACKLCESYDNGLWGDPDGYDPNSYTDGAHDIFWKDAKFYNIGIGTSGAGSANQRGSFAVGSENPSVSASYNIECMNCLIHTAHWAGVTTSNIPGTVSNITGLKLTNSTVVAYRSGSSDNVATMLLNTASTTNGINQKNNIFVGESDWYIDANRLTSARMNSNYNLFWRTGGNTTILNTCGWSWCGGSGTSYTLTSLQAATDDEDNSKNENPLFVTDTQGSYDLRLSQTTSGQAVQSPAVDAGDPTPVTCPSWVYSQWPTYFPECAPGENPIQGTTRTDGLPDTGVTDMGFHWPLPSVSGGPGAITAASVVHSSSTTSTDGTLTVSGTIENAWDADGKFTLTIDPDFTFNSGGTTTADCSSGCDGDMTVSISSNEITMTRLNEVENPVPSVLDDFNRANAGPPPSASWTTKNGDGWKVLSNQMQTQTTSGGWSNDYWNAATYTNLDAYAKIVTKPATGNSVAVQVRWDTAADTSYSVSVNVLAGTDTITLNYYNGSTNQVLATYDQEVTNGDGIRISVVGSSLRAYYKSQSANWISLGAAVTNTALSSAGRLGMFASNSSAVVIDDFGGGTITDAPAESSSTETAATTAIVISVTNVGTPDSEQTTSDSSIQTKTVDGSTIDTNTAVTGQTFTAPVVAPGDEPYILDGTYTISGTFKIEKQ